MTEISFVIQFPKFEAPPVKVRLSPGVHIVYGESGVGKSHLCRRLAALTQGTDHSNFRLSRISGFERPMLVAQDPDAQIVAPTVSRELAFNLENLGWSSESINDRILSVVERFDFSFELNRHPATLSGGERELLNLTSALTVSPDLLIIDDGFAFLSSRRKMETLSILKDWCERTGAVVFWMTSQPSDLTCSESRWHLRLDRLERLREHTEKTFPAISAPPGQLTFALDKVSFGYDGSRLLFEDLSARLHQIRSLGVLGENGSGKSTLGWLISQIEEPRAGRVSLELDGKPPLLAHLPQSPERLFGGHTPEEVVQMLQSEGYGYEGFVDGIIRSLNDFQIIWSRISRTPIHLLSLSEARILLIVILGLAQYDLLILDEPMFSLGNQQRTKMIEFLGGILSEKHLIFITHDEREARALCDSTVTISEGTIISHTFEQVHV